MDTLSEQRTAYLVAAYKRIQRDLLPQAPRPEIVALSWSFPCTNARGGGKSVRVGEYFGTPIQGSPEGEQHAIVISPRVWTGELEMLGVLAHEMVHACLPAGTKHKKPFKQLAGAIGLTPTKEADPAEGFRTWYQNVRSNGDSLPAFPAGALSPNKTGGGTRLRLWECSCPVKVRVASDTFDATCNRCEDPFIRQGGGERE